MGKGVSVDGPRTRRKIRLAAAAGVLVLAVLGFAAFEFAGHAASLRQPAGSPSPAAAAEPAPAKSAPAKPAPSKAPPARAAKSPSTAQSAPRSTQAIIPVSASAFGPDGTADGDNPQLAAQVITDPAAGWMTDWYATGQFDGEQSGTGLMLDMGRPVTIASVTVELGGLPGANLDLEAGEAPSPGSLSVVSSATDAGGAVDLSLKEPVQARYVLLWFTQLPPDSAGTYQAFVHSVTVRGQP